MEIYVCHVKTAAFGVKGGKKGGVLENFEIRYKHRNICGKIQGIQWCNPFFDIFNIKQVTAILRLFFCKNFGFWSPIIDPPIHIKKLARYHLLAFSTHKRKIWSKITFSFT